jgi:hypothetical protein
VSKQKTNTRRGLAAARQRVAAEKKVVRPTRRREEPTGMDKMLKGIDPERFERLADGK